MPAVPVADGTIDTLAKPLDALRAHVEGIVEQVPVGPARHATAKKDR